MMILYIISGVISVGLFVFLLIALFNPEKF